METIPQIGQNLRLARRKSYPDDTLEDFALRIGVSRATLQRMEKGDLSVSLGKYFQAATLLARWMARPGMQLGLRYSRFRHAEVQRRTMDPVNPNAYRAI